MEKESKIKLKKFLEALPVQDPELLQLVKSGVKSCLGHRHKWYTRVVEKAKFYKAMATGEDQEVYITSYKDKELEAQKENRIKITRTKTKSVTAKVLSQFERIHSQSRILDSFSYSTGETQGALGAQEVDTKTKVLTAATSDFVANKSVDLYLRDKFINLNLVDPNAFLLLVPKDGEVKNPVVVKSKHAWDYQYKNGELQYLTIGHEYEGYTDIYAYGKTYHVFITAYQGDTKQMPPIDGNMLSLGISGKQLVVSWVLFDPKAKQVPAIRWGTDKDLYTYMETCTSIIGPVEFEYKDLINRKSEYDLSLQLHLFLQKVQKGEPCKYTDPRTNEVCRDGYLSLSHSECPSCKGAGLQALTTSQDALIIRPNDEETMQPLSVNDFVKYIELPFDIVDHQHKIIYELPGIITTCIFGTDVSKIGESMNPATATEVSAKVNSMNKVLARYAEHMAEIKRFIIKQTAINLGIESGLAISIQAPQDFKILSIGTLLQMLKLAKEAGADADILNGIEKQIRERQNQDNQVKTKVAEVMAKFEPFRSVPEPLKSSYIMSLPDTDQDKILFLYKDKIFNNLLLEKPEIFVTGSSMAQKMAISEQVELIKQEMLSLNTSLTQFIENETEDRADTEE